MSMQLPMTLIRDINDTSRSLLLQNMAALSAVYVLFLSVLAEHRSAAETWNIISDVLNNLENLTRHVEESWMRSEFAAVEDDSVLGK